MLKPGVAWQFLATVAGDCYSGSRAPRHARYFVKATIWAGILALAPTMPMAWGADAPPALEFMKIEFRPFVGSGVEAERGTLVVNERHVASVGRTISLPVVRFRSTARDPKAPIVYLAGGPGGSGLLTARSRRFVLFQELRTAADVITFDQRGAGEARPSMSCSDRLTLPLDKPGDERAELDALLSHCRACAERLRAAGNDLAAYNTVESAHDIEQLRIALGAEKITLWGTSYGTHLALAYTRQFPTRVERLMLAGVEGPDHTLKLPSDQQKQLVKLAAWIQEDPEVGKAIPDFVALVRQVLERVEREPVTVEITPIGSTAKLTVAIGKWDLQRLTAEGIGRTRTARKLPALYWAMSHGDFAGVAPSVRSMRNQGLSSAMSYLMDCASGATVERLTRIEREAGECLLADAVNFPFPAIDAAWGAQDLGDAFRGPLRSDVAALLISGSLDGRTPPSNAEEILKGFPRGRHLIVDGAGHDEDLFSDSPEMRRRMVAFARGEEISTETIRVEPPRLEWPDRR